MLRALLFSRASLSASAARPSIPSRGVRLGFEEREKGLEDEGVRRHDQELLKKLAEAEAAKKSAESRAHAAEQKLKNNGVAPPTSSFTPSETFATNGENVTRKEFLQLRKEMVDRIRALEDEIHHIRYEAANRR